MRKVSSDCNVQFHARAGGAFVPYLQAQTPRLLLLAKSRLKELSVVLVGDKQISELHERFFRDPTTTDVITFPLQVDRAGRANSGELYLCVPMARREAKQRGTPPRDELLLYLLHGVLHLGGYDDRTEAAYNKMHKKEDQILSELGIGAVFAPDSRGGL